MHIGIDISRLATRTRTGTEHYTYELIRAMAQARRSYAYTLYCNARPAALPPLGSHVRLQRMPFPRLWTHIRLSLEMQRNPPDVLFIPSHVIPLHHPPQSVVTIHDLGYLVFPDTHPTLRRIDLHLSTMWSARAARQIIAVSHSTREALIHAYRIPPAKITVIHHGVAPHFRPVTDHGMIKATRSRYGIHGDYLLAIGTVQPRKNLVRLIDGLAHMLHSQTNQTRSPAPLSLVIAGKRGWMTTAIEQRAAEHGIKERVQFIGYVEDTDLPALLSGALAFVFPSLYEGFGMPVLEAMACGTPVLTSTTSSLPEIAGDAALLVNPHDTVSIAEGLARILYDTTLRDTLRARGPERAASFTWKRCAAETLQTLQATKIERQET